MDLTTRIARAKARFQKRREPQDTQATKSIVRVTELQSRNKTPPQKKKPEKPNLYLF